MSSIEVKFDKRKDSSPEYIRVKKSKRMIESKIDLVRFKDHEYIVLYSPSLSLSSYGRNLDEAKEMFRAALSDYFESLIQMKDEQIGQEPTKYGWSREKFKRKQFTSNVYVSKEGILKNFELPDDTEIGLETVVS